MKALIYSLLMMVACTSPLTFATEPIVFYACSAQCGGQTSQLGVFLMTTVYDGRGQFVNHGCLDWGTVESCEAKIREITAIEHGK